MAKGAQSGNTDLLGIAIIVFILIVVWIAPPGGTRNGGFGFVPGANISSSADRSPSGAEVRSPYRGISLGGGNASFAYQSYDEYVTIENWGNKSVDITGWQLKNGKDARAYNFGSGLQRFSADIALIPQASLLLSPSGQSFVQNVVLERGERAVITTGSVGSRSPYAISSFKENACTGYLEALPEYSFNPPLSQNCPRPADEPGLERLEPSCRRFVEGLASCRTPEIGGRDSEGELCPTCVNGVRLSSECAAFVEERFSYRGCVASHASDPGFHSSGRTWRIFLGRGWEMYADDYETIELFDREGNLVDFENY